LSALDPENEATYLTNAVRVTSEIQTASADIQAELLPVQDLKFVVFHDAYQYFEARFGLAATGSISLGDSAAPSPARISKLQKEIAAQGVECVLSEPQYSADLIKTVVERSDHAEQIQHSVLDPLGSTLELGPKFYTELLHDVAKSVVNCR
jgi:zinc transport system substrate-binding protein